VRRLLGRIAPAVYAVAATFIPKDPRMLCYFGVPGSDNAYAMFEHLIATLPGRHRHAWVVHDVPAAIARLEATHPRALRDREVIVLPRRSVAAVWSCLRARFIFFTHLTYGFARGGRGQTFVNLWHGMPLKTIAYLNPKRRDPVPYTDFTIASSPLFRTIMARCFAIAEERVLLVGQPRNDRLLEEAEVRLPFGRRRVDYTGLVVWMPTYRKWIHPKGGEWTDSRSDAMERLLDDEGLDRLDVSLRADGVLCIVKLHPLDEMNARKFGIRPNVIVLRNADIESERVDIYAVLSQADRLVTDYSSVFIDFALTGRPMGFYAPDVDEYGSERGFIEEVWEKVGLPGAPLVDEGSLLDFLAGRLDCPPVAPSVARAMHDGYSPPSCSLLVKALGLV
jgi:CDP-glycerol glycerophosphotransferase (TagB/SpsB family)